MNFIINSFLALLSGIILHPIHVSICEINHSIQQERLEIKIRIFADDFEDVLEERTGLRTKLGTIDELPDTDKFVEDYLKEKITVSINDTLQSVEYVGKELDDLAMVCYLYIPNVKMKNCTCI